MSRTSSVKVLDRFPLPVVGTRKPIFENALRAARPLFQRTTVYKNIAGGAVACIELDMTSDRKYLHSDFHTLELVLTSVERILMPPPTILLNSPLTLHTKPTHDKSPTLSITISTT